VFHDPAADDALIQALRETLAPQVVVHEVATDINDPALATAMAETLHELMGEQAGKKGDA
jgi:uncharacterized protein (UPF0261 family)